MPIEVKIPAVGESITSGVVSVWHKKSGDFVNEGEALFTLETDKVATEIVAEKAGVLETKVPEGQEVKIGEVVAIIEDSKRPPEETKAEAPREKKKEPEFVVTDRRKFTEEGERRPDVPAEAETATKAGDGGSWQASSPGGAKIISEKFTAEEAQQGPEPRAASEAEQKAQHEDYRAGSRQLDDLLKEKSGGQSQSFEMTFERLVASLYMTAMLQLGLMAPEGEQPRADILGARQTIDTLGILNEKTKGNVTPAEQAILQQSLFELRMAFLELTNAITRPPAPNAPAGGRK